MSTKEQLATYTMKLLPTWYPYLQLPSIAAEGTSMAETAQYVYQQFLDLRAVKAAIWTDCGGHPVVFAEFKGKTDKTVLFYNHYDVQPPIPLDEWDTAPFEPTIRDGKLFARGVCDDKGELMSRLTLIKYYNEHGGLPVNMKFIVEGEEEIGSPHVGAYVKTHAQELKADVCIWEGGGKNEEEKFQITCGMKGIVGFELSVETASKDLHSALACYADNAAWRLVQALSSLKGKDNTILVDGFYDDIRPLDEALQEVVEAYHFDAAKVKANNGLYGPFVTKDPKQALLCGSTLTINGISAGYEGPGSKTVIPKKAVAKLDCRLVPDQKPEKIVQLIQQQLLKNGYGDVHVTRGAGNEAVRSDISDSFIQLCIHTAASVYGKDNIVVVPNMPGSGPGDQFVNVLHIPLVLVGIRYAGTNQHAPNENIRLADYQDGTYYLYELLENYSHAQ